MMLTHAQKHAHAHTHTHTKLSVCQYPHIKYVPDSRTEVRTVIANQFS